MSYWFAAPIVLLIVGFIAARFVAYIPASNGRVALAILADYSVIFAGFYVAFHYVGIEDEASGFILFFACIGCLIADAMVVSAFDAPIDDSL